MNTRIRFFLLIILVVALFACNTSENSKGPDLDGPGSWGPLQDTVLLKNIEIIETQVDSGQWHAYVRDQSGKTHDIIAGDYVGENTGKVVEIRRDVVVIMQVVKNDKGEWIETPVEFTKR